MDVSVFGGEYNVVGIEVRKQGEEGVLVELRGEFDRHNLVNLQETLNGVVALRRPALVDLSGVIFLDVGTSRELTIRSLLYAQHLTPSQPLLASTSEHDGVRVRRMGQLSLRSTADPRLLSEELLKAIYRSRRNRGPIPSTTSGRLPL